MKYMHKSLAQVLENDGEKCFLKGLVGRVYCSCGAP